MNIKVGESSYCVEHFKHLGWISKIYISTNGAVILKEVGGAFSDSFYFLEFDVFEREVFWLKKMSNFNRVPSFIGCDEKKKIIAMNYMGERISKHTLPANWKQQIESLCNGLEQFECVHNDIKLEEILVHNGQINLCDFGWASLGNDLSIGEGLNCEYPPQINRCSNYDIMNKLLMSL